MSFPVVGRVYVGHRGGDAAFGHDGVCLSKERFADHADRSALREGFEGRAQSRAAGPDDENVVLAGLVVCGHKSLRSRMAPQETMRSEKSDEQTRQVKEIAMAILEDKRKSGFAAIVAARGFADGAGGRVQEKRAVVGFAVVVARGPKAQRANKNEESRGEWPPVMQGIDERRIERREVRAPLVILAFEGAQRGINAETT